MIWANLIHLSTNMWLDYETPRGMAADEASYYHPSLMFHEDLWDELLERMVEVGINMVVIDLGDGVKYEGHPEIAVKGAWSPKKLKRQLAKMRNMGLEPIPKLNFSACHDAWLGPYSRCVSTDAYYAVCEDLIAEAISLFDKPRFLHLGMDEETPQHQRRHQYMVVRQGDLWWHDLQLLVKQVEGCGVRAWVWSDYIWDHTDEFLARMPKSVLQSNWYYDLSFSKKLKYVRAYLDLEAHGYDQIPTGSNWAAPENFEKTVPYCSRNIAPKRLLGFLQTAWKPTVARYRPVHTHAIECVARARSRLPEARIRE